MSGYCDSSELTLCVETARPQISWPYFVKDLK